MLLLTAHAEDEPEDEADDDELTEVDSDASEVEHVVPKKILAHSLQCQWCHENGGLWSVWARLQLQRWFPKPTDTSDPHSSVTARRAFTLYEPTPKESMLDRGY